MRGRRPDPAAVREQKGNPGKRAREPRLPLGDDGPSTRQPPEWLKGAPARGMFAKLAPELVRQKFLRDTDVNAFARYCRDLTKWIEVSNALDKEDVTYETDSAHGRMRRINPLFMVQERLSKRLMDLEDRFGLNPAARQSILTRMATQTPQLPLEAPTQPVDAVPPQPSPIGLLARKPH